MTNNDIRPSKPASPLARLTVGAEHDIVFTDLLANGQAVGRAGGLVVFCFGPLPHEKARVRITSVKQKYSVAQMLQLISQSPQRAVPFCPVFGTCGGCQVQHLSYDGQLTWKTGIVRSALERIGGFRDAAVRGTVGTIHPRAYRNKMSLVVESRGAEISIGFYKQRSHDIVAIDGCPIVAPQLDRYIGRLNAARKKPETAAAFLVARHIVSRSARATGEAVVTVTTAQLSREVESSGTALLAQLPGAVGLTNSYELSGANAIVGRRHRLIFGRSEIEETVAGVRYRVSASSFFQVNVEILGRIFAFLRRGLDVARKVVDLYCGSGTFALFFATLKCDVYGIEENPQAIDEARDNAALNGLEDRVRFRAGRVEDIVRTAEGSAALKDAEIAFLDPPRKGCDEVTLQAIADAGTPYVWYLSCDPATLARDLKYLAANGYRLGVVQPFDMFPQTGHVETLVTLYRENRIPRESLRDAFLDAPEPAWPDDEFARDRREYPDFVIRED
ncbi:MAG: 23S rRNA (uracil(1939)-C(5))-methyltransferase RlmD [Candidatus Eremiobacteraeota bacterium]|nr:23S rRNA (uracil(1939)-C(5))-methyltransferase RlmD [Candidatus Eremiobacteraeota bacterium]